MVYVAYRTERDRFYGYVDRGADEECWIWLGPLRSNGYGQFNLTSPKGTVRRSVAAHRYAMSLVAGWEAIDSMLVCHHCDNPPCCNPAHLFIGTHTDNMQDCLAKGRHGFGRTSRPGESSKIAKITEAEAREIIWARAAGETCKALGERMGLSPVHVWRIGKGLRWTHLVATPGSDRGEA